MRSFDPDSVGRRRWSGRAAFGYSDSGSRHHGCAGKAGPIFSAELRTSIARAYGSGSPTFTRATTAYQEDFEGKLNLALSGEARFQGARRVRNCLADSSVLTVAAGWTFAGTLDTGVSDPDGGTSAITLTATGVTQAWYGQSTTAVGDIAVPSVWIRRRTGTGNISILDLEGVDRLVTGALTTSWQRFADIARTAATTNGYFGVRVYTSGDAIDVWHPQYEKVTGQANQNPSEYVSVGVLSAPFHGAGVDGVKYFNTLNGNTVASNVVTEATGAAISSSTAKFASLPGASGSYFSTPDSVTASITGDIDIRAQVAATDWSPAVETRIVNKTTTDASGFAYVFRLDGSGTSSLQLYYSTDGTTLKNAVASTVTGFQDGTQHWVRATLAVATGDVKFYICPTEDGVTWVQLGTTQSTAAGAVFDSPAEVRIGINGSGTTGNWYGNIYRAQIYNGINGTLAVDFNPNLSTSAQTFTAATGEVWTTNGTARIYGNTHATYGIPAQWDAYGPYGYLAEGARTNDILQSNTLGTTWTISNAADMNAVAADAYVSVDGTTTMDKLQPKNTTAVHSLDQAFTWTAAKYTVSADLRYVPATPQRWVALVCNDGTTTWAASFDLLNGVAGAVSAAGGGFGAATSTIEPTAQANVYRCTVTNSANAAAAAGTVKISLNATDTATLESALRAGTETLGAGMVGVEIGAFASTRIITTTAAVTRNADVLTYPSAGNISLPATIYYEAANTNIANPRTQFEVTDAGFTNLVQLYTNASAQVKAFVYNGSTQADLGTRTITANTVYKVAAAVATNNVQNSVNGQAVETDSSAVMPTGFTTIYIGQYHSGDNGQYGTIRNVRIYNRALPAAVLQTLTT